MSSQRNGANVMARGVSIAMVSIAVSSMAMCLVDDRLTKVTSHLYLNEGPEHGVQARPGAGLVVQPRAPAAAEGALPRPRRVRLCLAPVARLMQPVAPRYARYARGRYAYGARSVVPSRGKLPCASGTSVRWRRYAYPVRTARLQMQCGFTCQHSVPTWPMLWDRRGRGPRPPARRKGSELGRSQTGTALAAARLAAPPPARRLQKAVPRSACSATGRRPWSSSAPS